ncbi:MULTISPECIES: NUMOD4 domain-containing protein [Bacillus]|uniref:Prophage LambdaBa03, HNH endonuclease family protein n=4 Tax=Bacillus anthracis TaxID=1392 RepID=A0AAC8SCT1_BACAN|nr:MULTISPECIES: NUMOD4 domain-containing protein [Bacillus]EJT20205.1 Prophage LambdaBa03, HNH endonuclease family protein [Bacillus anthracis str. UR-1]AAP29004.1 prophage LambdaBa03, HNH endonuclease family protein [Bacillus anthracis str. Ames]AAT34477.1 prophage LambdaBa03, HNH endonuclease family protein [Bacillus anthracis str. 'Ames Ancestor']AAT57255.1 prophage LambdaBa03, HNH endonuclease family protein [Bacillus anthracis str. Sterne]ACP17088.1 prophage LambdaBa03, HNH endonuclease 
MIYKNLSLENLPNEIWEKCDESEHILYTISSMGRVKSTNKNSGKSMIMKQTINNSDYLVVNLTNKKTHYVHRLVAMTFISNPKNKPTVNHINIDELSPKDNKLDNRVINLEWATMKEQSDHAWKSGLKSSEQLSIPVVVLNTNGEFLSSHIGFTEASNCYEGTVRRYEDKVAMIGNNIVLLKSKYEEMSDQEIFILATKCFEKLFEKTYEVDGIAIATAEQTAKALNCSRQTVHKQTSTKWSAEVNGKTVSRLKNRIGVFNEAIKKEKI